MKWNAAEFWGSEKRAEGYAKRDFLVEPEKVIIERFKDRWGGWRLLDIGVGGGRTTSHFAPLVKEYVGTDFAPIMIDYCKKRFGGQFLNTRYLVQDVRSMVVLDDDYFDFVMFSYNGLSELQHEDMPTALAEIRRVMKPSGYFFFSQHNILWANNIFALKFLKRPDHLLRSIYRTLRFRSINANYKEITSRDYAELHDYPFDFKKLTYYTSPMEQVRQLKQAGFEETEIFLNSSGEKWCGDLEDAKEEPFLHYLCRVKLVECP